MTGISPFLPFPVSHAALSAVWIGNAGSKETFPIETEDGGESRERRVIWERCDDRAQVQAGQTKIASETTMNVAVAVACLCSYLEYKFSRSMRA